MIGNARSDELIFCRVIDKVADARYGGCIGGILAKEDLDASAAWLMLSASLKCPSVAAAQSGPYRVAGRKAMPGQYLLTTSLLARYGIACLGHVVCMLDFERDAWVGGVVASV